jgi:tRNA(fMet)-specific endonuclease VapC
MIYILDTDHFTLAVLPDSPEYARLNTRALELTRDDDLVTTIITYEEQTRGWLGYAKKSLDVQHQIKAYARLKRHLQNYLGFPMLDFDQAAATQYERLQSLKIRIGTPDLKIAAIALANNATLLTRNGQHYSKIPDLRIEDWIK